MRFCLGAIGTNKNYAGWFLKTSRMGITMDAGGSAEGSAGNCKNKLNATDGEEADEGD